MNYTFSKKVSPKWKNASTGIISEVLNYEYKDQPCICGLKEKNALFSRDRFGLFLTFVMCSNCGTIRVDPQPSEENLKHFYRDCYRDLYFNMHRPRETLLVDEQQPRGRKIAALLERNGIKVCGKKILEIGAGAGGILDVLKELGAETTALEPSKEYADFMANENRHKVYNLFLDQSNQRRLDDSSYDVIIISHVLEHVVNPNEFISIIKRKLRKGGVVFIEVPSIECMGELADRFLDFFHFAHLWYFNENSMRIIARTAGLKIDYLDNYCHAILRNSEDLQSIQGVSNNQRKIKRLLIRHDILSRIGLLGAKRRALNHLARVTPAGVKKIIKACVN